MGRHTIINPKTGRRVLKTGALGRKISKGKDRRSKKPAQKEASGAKSSSRSKPFVLNPLVKTSKTGGTRPSARAMYDLGVHGPVFYDGRLHVMCFRANGSPFYKPV